MKQSDDPVVALMRQLRHPSDAGESSELAFMGDKVELDAESEANLPTEIQRH